MGQETAYVAFRHYNVQSLIAVFSADKVIPRQIFEVPIQAAIGKRIVARETLSAYRADVTAGLYGGIVNLRLVAQ